MCCMSLIVYKWHQFNRLNGCKCSCGLVCPQWLGDAVVLLSTHSTQSQRRSDWRRYAEHARNSPSLNGLEATFSIFQCLVACEESTVTTKTHPDPIISKSLRKSALLRSVFIPLPLAHPVLVVARTWPHFLSCLVALDCCSPSDSRLNGVCAFWWVLLLTLYRAVLYLLACESEHVWPWFLSYSQESHTNGWISIVSVSRFCKLHFCSLLHNFSSFLPLIYSI